MAMYSISCRDLRKILNSEWRRFFGMSYSQICRYIRYNFDCSSYAVRTLARELSGYHYNFGDKDER